MNWTCNKPCFLPSQNGLKAQILLLHVHGKGLKPNFYYFTRWVQSPNIYILRSGLTHVPLSPLIGLKPISCSSINQGSWPTFFLSYLKKWTSTIKTHIYTKFKGKMPNHSGQSVNFFPHFIVLCSEIHKHYIKFTNIHIYYKIGI